jgi:16S rRNA (guanine(527)-N(7))-methyltransferase GidB
MFLDYASVIQDLTAKLTGFELTSTQISQFCLYGDLLQEWNQRMNLTRITEPNEVVVKHFIDSMILASYIHGTSFADLGTGAGFPGVPLKVLRPELNIVLMDSLKKRLGFLEVVIDRLNLTGIETVHARAEEFGKNALYRDRFETVSSRAVARLPILLEYALPVLKINGLFIAPKGLKAEEEVAESHKALKLLGGEIEGIERYSLGEGAEFRFVILIRKVKATPSLYPRQPGRPEKNPLI